jgi:hypothetical protein
MVELTTLGSLSLRQGGVDLLPGRRKVLALLTYLIRQGGPVPREALAQTFWMGSSEARARHSLRQAISELRTTLGEGLEIGADHVAVLPGRVQLDADVFARDIEGERWEAGLACWRGEFLPGLEDLDGGRWRSWLDGERSRLTVLRARALAAVRPDGGSARTTVPPSVQAAPRWAAPREVAAFSPTREITGGLLGTLSTEARAVIEAAAVLGRRMDSQPLSDIAGLSRNGFASAVDELTARGMLHPAGTGDEALEFTSEDARQRVYQLVAGDRRRHLHQLAARALARGTGLDFDTAEHERLSAPPPQSSDGRVVVAILLLAAAALAAAWYLIPRIP